jgi:hypothetical protein
VSEGAVQKETQRVTMTSTDKETFLTIDISLSITFSNLLSGRNRIAPPIEKTLVKRSNAG